ncbi:hypothetical protein, variant 1 [Aphanomyces astaci]|uniref:GRAM domain-containing protein n=1 Tax=Aphanomyces astaci TaxID=112090 RepID=W4G2A4_APHAT|nr:hypothetical protein, variant 1 [Aphanomyces astaci]ETV73852.1 hypothetical protein, variant 1 [Aphanomyces astaci]|eukprot:XP_009836787.1 hypothetical protein, variant 1 [Aphanomyces astaci]
MSSGAPLQVDTNEDPSPHDPNSIGDVDMQTPTIEASTSPVALSALVHQTVEMLSDGTTVQGTSTHPDFRKLTPDDATVVLSESAQDVLREAESWLSSCPVQSRQWIIYEAKLRPDVSMSALHDLVSTILLTHGFQLDTVSSDDPSPLSSGLYRRMIESSTAFQSPAHDLVYARIGVSSSKLRVLRIFVGVVGGTGVPFISTSSSATIDAQLHRTADAIFTHVQAAILDVGYALAMLSSPSFCDASDDSTSVALDDDYVKDVTVAFDMEMKATLRQLSLPLEEYAHAHEVATAHLLSLVEPLYLQFHLEKPQPPRPSDAIRRPPQATLAKEELLVSGTPTTAKIVAAMSRDGESRGRRVTQLVHALWEAQSTRVKTIVDAKVREKQAQIGRRVEYTKHLRHMAIHTIVQSAQAKPMLQRAMGSAAKAAWEGAVLYEGAGLWGKLPVKFYVTFDRVVIKTGVFMFASFKDIAFDTIVRVTKPHVLGISVISLHTQNDHQHAEVQLTLASDVDRVFELLYQICIMHNMPEITG